MEHMAEFAQPVLVALLVLLVPATGRYLLARIGSKLDEGRRFANERAVEIKRDLEEKHIENAHVLASIRQQVQDTNGTVSKHTIQLARIEGAVFGAKEREHTE